MGVELIEANHHANKDMILLKRPDDSQINTNILS